jgi:DNA-binding MarR family transcriptional regulator
MRKASASKRPGSVEEQTVLELMRTADALSRGPAQVLKDEELTAAQYNVLRILRGAPDGLTCGDIAGRMITRDPDITRLLDRLDRRGLIARARGAQDRRVVLTRITPSGDAGGASRRDRTPWPGAPAAARRAAAGGARWGRITPGARRRSAAPPMR